MKNLQNKLPVITADELLSGNLSSWVPELYDQKQVIAINLWHDHQSIFDHTVSVLTSLEHIVTFPFAGVTEKQTLTRELDQNIDGVPRLHILFAVALLHDIGCGKTLVTDPKTGENSCPGHEVTGRDMSIAVCQRWRLTNAVTGRISGVIFRHLDIHRAVNESLAAGTTTDVFNKFRQSVGDMYLDLLLQGYADTAGSDLPILQPKQYLFRENIYREEIIRYAASR